MRFLLLLLVLSIVFSACATSPTGRSQVMVAPEHTIDRANRRFREAVEEISRDGKLLNDPEMALRVGQISDSLVAEAVRRWPHTAGWQWSVVLIDDPEQVNAGSMAGGHIAIYSGLLAEIDPDDDELAFVLGHEIAHSIANHQGERTGLSLVHLAIALAFGPVGSLAGAIAGDLFIYSTVHAPNNRRAESEADELGLELAIAAGYEPDGAAHFMKKVEAKTDNPDVEVFAFLLSHPSYDDRLNVLTELAKAEPRQASAAPVEPHPVRVYWAGAPPEETSGEVPPN